MDANASIVDLPYEYASGADIIRANQKDQYYASSLLSQIESVARRVLGARALSTRKEELKTITNFLYLGLTTLIARRTLGEEYCDLTYSGPHGPPSSRRRSFYVASTALGPYFLAKLLPILKRFLATRFASHKRVTSLLDYIAPYLTFRNLETLHLAVFYLTGAFYTFSRRFSNLRYIFTRKVNESPERIGYEVLGCLMLARLLIPSLTGFYSSEGLTPGTSAVPKVTIDLEDESRMKFLEGQARKCTLCLGEMQDPTATPCGHLFCWTCINEWSRSKVRHNKRDKIQTFY